MNSSIECFNCSLVLRVISDSIDSINFFWLTKLFKNIFFELSSVISLKSIRNICVVTHFLKTLKIVSAFLSFNGIIHPYFVKWSNCKDLFKSISYLLWKKNCACLASFFWFIRFNMFYYCIFSWFRKKLHSILHLLWNLLFVFEKHRRMNSFWKSSALFICCSFIFQAKF